MQQPNGLPALLAQPLEQRIEALKSILESQAHQLTPALEAPLLMTLAISDFVSDSLQHFPDLSSQLLTEAFLNQPLDMNVTKLALESKVKACEDEASLFSCLRNFRRLQQMRLIHRDLNGLATLKQTLAELTFLADTCIQLTLDWQHARLTKRYGEPTGKTTGELQKLIVIAMGKQGAGELNLSSDIDLIFAFHENGDTAAGEGQKSLSNQEFFTKLGQALIQSLDKITADGFVYRVDMRLRPYGQSGPLAMNFDESCD